METISSCFATHPLAITELEDCDSDSPHHDGDSPSSVDHKNASSSSSSPKRKRAMHKRVVTVPIKEVESSRVKGETAPPSDSWAWRKYGQKPIKGSPYPRGYYRCSSSKGCPARKQVERSRLDPAMLVVTYTSEHNHPLPPSRNHHHSTRAAAAAKELDQDVNSEPMESKLSEPETEPQSEPVASEKFTELDDVANLGWFADMEATSTTRMLDSPMFTESTSLSNMAMLIPMMREEDESLFADLGELPECSFVFRRDMPRGCMTTSSWCAITK